VTKLQLRDRTVDLDTHMVTGPSGEVRLTATEGKLLHRLWADVGRVVHKSDLLRDAMGYREGVQTRALDTAIRRLRKKLEAPGSSTAVIAVVFGVGYRLDVEVESPLLGRTEVLRQVEADLHTGITVVEGTGGVGKTRLARVVVERWPAGSVFIDLSSANTAAELVEAVARALGLPRLSQSVDRQHAQVAAVLARRSGDLLVLDNLEQLDDAAFPLLSAWHQSAPDLAMLLTSRRALPLRDAEVHALGPLSTDAAVELYIQRAAERLGGFSPDAVDRAQLAQFVDAVDGLPLAIELAASRAAVLSPHDLVRRAALSLRGESTDHGARTLDECIRWSWELLDPDQRAGWVAASAFEGGFALEQWEQVAEVADPLGTLESLLDHHLIAPDPGAGARRYRILLTLHRFAREQLERSAQRPAIERRHWAAFAEAATTRMRRAEATGDLSWQVTEHHNLRVAFERALPHDLPAALACLRALEIVFQDRGPLDERLELTQRALDATGSDRSDLRAPLLIRRGMAEASRGQLDIARACGEEALALLPQIRSPQDRARLLLGCGAIQLYTGQIPDAVRTLQHCATEARTAGDDFLLGLSHYNRGHAQLLLEQTPQALEAVHLAVAILQSVPAPTMVAAAHSLIAAIQLEAGELDGARVALEYGAQQKLHKRGLIWLDIRMTQGHLELAAGHADQALQHFDAAIQAAQTTGFVDLLADLRMGRALALADQGEGASAEAALAEARAHYQRWGAPEKAALALGISGAITWMRGGTQRGLAQLRQAEAEVSDSPPSVRVPLQALLCIALAEEDAPEAARLGAEVLEGSAEGSEVLGALADVSLAALPQPAPSLSRAERLQGSHLEVRLALRMLQRMGQSATPMPKI